MKITSLERMMKTVAAENDQLQKDCDEITFEKNNLVDRLYLKDTELKDLNENLIILQNEKGRLTSDLVKERESCNEEKTLAKSAYKKECEQTEAHSWELVKNLKQMQALNQNLCEEKENLSSKVDDLESVIDTLENKLKQSESRCNDIETQKEDEILNLKQKFVNLNEEKINYLSEVEALKEEKKNIKELQKNEINLTNHNALQLKEMDENVKDKSSEERAQELEGKFIQKEKEVIVCHISFWQLLFCFILFSLFYLFCLYLGSGGLFICYYLYFFYLFCFVFEHSQNNCGLIFTWIKFCNFSNFFAFHEN